VFWDVTVWSGTSVLTIHRSVAYILKVAAGFSGHSATLT
jgi:hypothetical protein